VRTKHVTFDPIPTLANIRGLAVYGPGASLFTLGPNNTAQQYDLNIPAQLVANVQHPANLLPPSPPVSIEEQKKQKSSAAAPPAVLSAVPINIEISESDEDVMSPLATMARQMDKFEQEREEPDRAGNVSPVSSRSRASTTSRSSAGSRAHQGYRKAPQKTMSIASRDMSESATTMSVGSTVHTRAPSVASRDSFSMSSVTSSHVSRSSRRGGSRLRQEVLRSPEEQKVLDLFKFARARLTDVPYSHPGILDNTRLTVNDLRQQMLRTIFGWHGEADELIQDEISRHPAGAPQRLLLAKWIGDIDADVMANSSESMTSSDWMLLALSGIGGSAAQAKVARAYVQRLLEKGDVHTAATILIGMGDQNDAIEVYVSHKRYMEAVILTCLVYPADWSRQAELVKKWGGWAVQHNQQQLAIRCFSCTESESTEPWFSPSAQALTFSQQQSQSIPELLSPPLSPPGPRGPQRSIAKTSALKLITSFGDKAGKAKFFGLGDDDRTPVGGGVTPIAESAISPHGGDMTAFLRPSQRSVLNTPASARTATPGGFARQRLPSIGEMPSDVVIPRRHLEPIKLPTPADSGSDRENKTVQARTGGNATHPPNLQLNSATYDPISRTSTASPMMEKPKYKLQPLPSPSPESFNRLQTRANSRQRNGSRTRKPDDLTLNWPPMESIVTGDYMTSPDPSVASSRITTASRSVAGSIASSTKSPVVSERSYRSEAASPVVTGRSIDEYISSLDSARYHKEQSRPRHESRDRHARTRSSSRKPRAREPSEDRSRNNTRYIKPAKRSPTSPVPMSPEDLIDLSSVKDVPFSPTESTITSTTTQTRQPRESSRSRTKSSRNTSRVRRVSPEPSRTQGRASSRAPSRSASRRPSPGRLTMIDTKSARGRSQGREGSGIRSPSSPLPMSPQAKFYQDEDDEDLRKAHEDQMRFRETRSRHRSTSRMRDRSTARQESPERRRRDRSTSRRPAERDTSRARKDPSSSRLERQTSHARSMSQMSNARSVSGRDAGDLNLVKDARTLKKEQAARELEERRKSLALRPMAPPIVHPEEIATLSPVSYRRQQSPELHRSVSRSSQNPPRSQTNSPAHHKDGNGSAVQVGLPATPKAMKHPKYDPEGDAIPDVPSIPEKYDSGSGSGSPPGSNWGSLNAISYNSAFETLGPLPKTTYAAAPRRVPSRCASAPIPEEPPHSPNPLPAALPMHPAFQAALPPSTRRRTPADSSSQKSPGMPSPRKINPGESQPGTLGYEARNNSPVYSSHPPSVMGGIDGLIQAERQPTSANDNLIPPPPPPPPAPPILSQLQHLATPPPPPPAPIFNPNNTHSMVSGVSTSSGDIEIVMDDDTDTRSTTAEALSPPLPPFAQGHVRKNSIGHSRGHSRGRSETNNSISGRFTRAAERLRSASRGRNSPNLDRTKSPPIEQYREPGPYESVPPPNGWNPSRRPSLSSPSLTGGNMNTERHPREVKAAMNQMEGGMI
jgi:hypothetical protein